MTNTHRQAFIALVLTSGLGANASAQDNGPIAPLGPPSGTFVLQSDGTNVFGSGWGKGTLTFQGRAFVFSADGIQPAKSSEPSDRVAGEVYNLLAIDDFPGFYSTLESSSKPDSHYLQNEHYVVIHVTKSRDGVLIRPMTRAIRVDLAN